MSIKMIAVDMDGTFLNKQSVYDKDRFSTIYKELKERGIRFVVASGNPLRQLQGTFDDFAQDLTYIAENGGYIVEQGKELYSACVDTQSRMLIIEALKSMRDVLCWVCTKHQSYALQTMPESYYQMFLPYFPGVKKISCFSMIEDPITKFALFLPDGNVEERMHDFIRIVSDQVQVVDSGHACVDIIPTHVNKGEAIQFLMDRYHLSKDEVMAFGDAGNDIEMLKKVTYGYAMENASLAFQEQFQYLAPSNDAMGVLTVLEQYIKEGTILNLK